MSHEANVFLLDGVPSDYLDDRYSPRSRTVAAQSAHMLSVRPHWLVHAEPRLVVNVKPFSKGSEPTKAPRKAAPGASERIVAQFLRECEAAGAVKSWSGLQATFLGYLIAHEAHRRGLGIVAMKLSGRKLSPALVYRQWPWGKQRKMR